MKEFRIELPNEPGQLARLCQALGLHGIDIHSIASVGTFDPAIFALLTDNEAATRPVLEELGFQFREVEVLTIKILDHAGELSRFARQLGNETVNIDSIYVVGKTYREVELAFTTSDTEKAKRILGIH